MMQPSTLPQEEAENPVPVVKNRKTPGDFTFGKTIGEGSFSTVSFEQYRGDELMKINRCFGQLMLMGKIHPNMQ